VSGLGKFLTLPVAHRWEVPNGTFLHISIEGAICLMGACEYVYLLASRGRIAGCGC
jgi:hypothetical protein